LNRSGVWQRVMVLAAALAACSSPVFPGESPVPATHVLSHLESSCLDCHDADTAQGKLAIPALGTDLSDTSVRDTFALMHDRVA